MSKRANLKDELAVKERPEPKTYIPPPAREGKVMMNVLMDPIVRDQFKAAAAENGTTIQALIRGFVNQFLEEKGRKPLA